ncbi:MAG: pyrroline-5-carboxylate reductase [Candidatus Margulisiibacteriota bacterium]|nr:pyrroline-5-carboxylate reductase [Candidatus Margulisiibacteriota bacterium]
MSDKIGFIGFGNMGSAVGLACCQSGHALVVSEPNLAVQNNIKNGAITFCSSQDVFESAKYIFLATKPQMLDVVSSELKAFINSNHIIISMLAGVTIKSLENAFGTDQVCRIMPNTPAMLKSGVTGVFFGSSIDSHDKDDIINLCQTFGENIVLDDEDDMHVITAISGSGPAFFYRVISMFTIFAQSKGLNKTQALKAATNTMLGSAKMLNEFPDPETLIKNVTSPNGTTFAGLNQMDKHLLDEKFEDVLNAAFNRSIELSKGDV